MDGKANADEARLPALDEVFQPWELAGTARFDSRPHRAGFLLIMTRISLLLGGLSLLCPPLGLIGLPLALLIRAMARRDLDAMFAGDMDQGGRQRTEKAWSDCQAAAFVNTLGCLVCGAILAILHFLVQSALD